MYNLPLSRSKEKKKKCKDSLNLLQLGPSLSQHYFLLTVVSRQLSKVIEWWVYPRRPLSTLQPTVATSPLTAPNSCTTCLRSRWTTPRTTLWLFGSMGVPGALQCSALCKKWDRESLTMEKTLSKRILFLGTWKQTWCIWSRQRALVGQPQRQNKIWKLTICSNQKMLWQLCKLGTLNSPNSLKISSLWRVRATQESMCPILPGKSIRIIWRLTLTNKFTQLIWKVSWWAMEWQPLRKIIQSHLVIRQQLPTFRWYLCDCGTNLKI